MRCVCVHSESARAPRLNKLTYRRRDWTLTAFGVLILLLSIGVGFVGLGNFGSTRIDQAGGGLKKPCSRGAKVVSL